MTSDALAAVFAASLLQSVLPGPGMILTATRSATGGLGPGLCSMAGVLVSRVLLGSASLTLIAGAWALPEPLLALVRWLGSALLLLIALRLCRVEAGFAADRGEAAAWAGFAEALVLGLVNPINLLFCLAILPQVLPPGVLMPDEAGLLVAALVAGAFCAQSLAILIGLGAFGRGWLPALLLRRLVGAALAGFALSGLAVPLDTARAFSTDDPFQMEISP